MKQNIEAHISGTNNITVSISRREADFSGKTWVFFTVNRVPVLTNYQEFTCTNGRKNASRKTTAQWDYYASRDCTIHAEAVHIPQSVADAAKEAIMDKFREFLSHPAAFTASRK